MYSGSPKFLLPTPPPIQLTATGIKLIPIIVMIVPVTTGGNRRIKRLKNGATRNVKIPATIIAP